MSSRALRRIRGNRVFEIAEQLGLDKSDDENAEEEYESSSEEELESINETSSNVQSNDKNNDKDNGKSSQLTEEQKKRKKLNKKKQKKRKQKKKAEEAAKKAKEKEKAKKKKQQKNKNKNKNKNKKQNQKSPLKQKDNKTKEEEEEKKTDENEALSMEDDICTDWDVLISDSRFFDPNFEMKKKYGSIAMEANDEYVEDTPNQYKPKNAKQARAIKARKNQLNMKYGHLQKRKISLIKFNSQKWPTPYLHFSRKTGNIYMELINEDNKKGIKYFQFKYDKDYNMVQMEYKQRCARFNPEEISFLLQQHPYHVDTCLTMSDILNKHGRLEEAADMVERALYRLETGLHSRFSFIASDCRLDYSIIENRSFFLALWKYSQNLGRRGCVNSAFQITKKVLSLSPLKDPLCSLLCLDYWGLRSGQYQWILQFAKSFKININNQDEEQMDALRMYPNWLYSVAFAKYHLELKESFQQNKKIKESTSYKFGDCDNSKIPMDLAKIEGLSSSILIQQAILMFPEVLGPLLKKANERILGQSQWKMIMENPYFLKAKLRRNEIASINKLCNIYSERAHALWNNEDLFKWLWKHCRFILDRLKNPRSFKIVNDDADDIYANNNQPNDDNDNNDGNRDIDDDELIEMEDLTVFDGIRDSVYNNTHKNKFQMLDINDFSDVITTLPAEELPDALMRPQRINLDALNRLNGDELNRVVEQLLASGIELPPEIQQRLDQGQNLQNQNVLQAMLYSMMPWVNPIMNQNQNNNNHNNDDNDDNDDNDENKNNDNDNQ